MVSKLGPYKSKSLKAMKDPPLSLSRLNGLRGYRVEIAAGFSSGEFRQFCKQGVELRASQPL